MKIGDLIGGIIGAGPGEVVMQPNVSVCQSIVLSCFDWTGKRNKIVSEDVNFPSNLYIYKVLERAGARLATVPSPDGITAPIERMLAAITRRAHQIGAKIVARYLSLSRDGASECA